MLTRALRLVSLPMLGLLLAIPARAHAAAPDADDASTNCTHEQDKGSQSRADLPPFAPLPADENTVTHFSAARALSAPSPTATTASAHIAICRASVNLAPSPDADVHLSIDLSKPLPGGQLASHLLRRFVMKDGALELEMEAPEGISARVQLALPRGMRSEFALVRGDLEVLHLLGDAQIAIVKGNATLHLADADFATLECATILGGIRDRRPGGSTHGRMLSTWTARGTGTPKIEFSAVSGDLILLPRPS